MSGIDELGAALDELRGFLERRKWKHCLIGGLAANRWGEVRFTHDIDIVVLSPLGKEEHLIDSMLANFPARAGKTKVREFAHQTRVLLLQSTSGIPIDVSIGVLPFEEEVMSRARPVVITRGHKFRTATPEDIVLMKTLAGRPHDWRDIEGIIVRQGSKLDWNHIRRWLPPLLELFELPERHIELRALQERLARESASPFRRSKKSPRKKRGS